ncbi:hypothetical protein Tco_0666243 [Tanacetum coccineum]
MISTIDFGLQALSNESGEDCQHGSGVKGGVTLFCRLVTGVVPHCTADPLVCKPEVREHFYHLDLRVLDLVDYSSSSNSDPSEDSLHVPPELPLVSPFLCTDDSGADNSSSSSSSSDSSSDISSGSSSDSLSDSSSVHSSGCDASGQSHSGPSTRVASPRLVDPPRCRSPTTLVPSSTPVSRSIAPALADLLPRKRFRDSYSFEASGEEHMEIGTADVETVADLGISDGVGAPTEDGIGMGVEVATMILGEEETRRFFEARGQCGGTMEIKVDPLAYWRTGEPRVRALLCIERDRVDSLRRHMALSQEEFRQICRDRDDTRRRLRRLESLVERRFGICRSVV